MDDTVPVGVPDQAPVKRRNQVANAALGCAFVGFLFLPIIFAPAAVIMAYIGSHDSDGERNRSASAAGVIAALELMYMMYTFHQSGLV